MKNIKLLSICIPTYNRKALLKRQLFFLKKQIANLSKLSQEELEVIVSVNPSPDFTEEYISKQKNDSIFKYYINESNIGGMPNMNIAIRRACGKYIWIISDDDIIIEGILPKIFQKLHQYKNLSWFFINFAGLNGSSSDPNSYLTQYKNILPFKGYYHSGKKLVIELLKKVDGGLLFCTANLFLRDAAIKILQKYPSTNNATDLVSYILYSATWGGAYIEDEPFIIAGGGVNSWADNKYHIIVNDFNETLLHLEGYGYNKKEVLYLIKYRMCHKALIIWFYIFKAIITNPSKGFLDYQKYLRLMPYETIAITIFAPIVAIYLHLRHLKNSLEQIKLIFDNGGTVNAYWKMVWDEYPKLL